MNSTTLELHRTQPAERSIRLTLPSRTAYVLRRNVCELRVVEGSAYVTHMGTVLSSIPAKR